jgi:hypothetical protein
MRVERNFVSRKNRTPEYEAAITALRKLITPDNHIDMAQRAFAEAVCDETLKKWAALRGLKPAGGHPCVHRLLGKRCSGLGDEPCYPPNSDHLSMWNRNGRPYCLVSQPYGLNHKQIQEIMHYCQTKGLTVDIDTWPAWHFPGVVLHVLIRRAHELE